jgi:hypothetical protein
VTRKYTPMNIPEDLKIHPPEWPDAAELAREVGKPNEESSPQAAVPTTRTVERLPESVARTLLALAMNVWRIRARLTDLNREPREEIGKDDVKKINRYCDAMFQSLSSIGMEVKDRTGEAFDYGLPEKVLTAQPQTGLTREIIIETIRPTIYWNTQIAQPGEVVIGTPPEASEKKEA